jgi:hypothetical protein
MDDLGIDQLRTLAKMSVPAMDGQALDQLAKCGLFVVHCYAMMLLVQAHGIAPGEAEAEKAEAAKAKTK